MCVERWETADLFTLSLGKDFISGIMGVAEYEKITKEEAIAIENAGDPIDAPPGKKCFSQANFTWSSNS